MLDKILAENSLYIDSTSRDELISDKKACMDALLVNFFGFLGLYKLSDKRGPMKDYEKTEGKLMLQNISDTNHDVSLVIKLAVDAKILTLPIANMMTRLLALIKQRQVKSKDIDEQKIRDILSGIQYKVHMPSPRVYSAISLFQDGTYSLEELAKELYAIAKSDKKIYSLTSEFRNLVLKGQYTPLFAKIPASSGTRQTSTSTLSVSSDTNSSMTDLQATVNVSTKVKSPGIRKSKSTLDVSIDTKVNSGIEVGTTNIDYSAILKELFANPRDKNAIDEIFKKYNVKSNFFLPDKLEEWIKSEIDKISSWRQLNANDMLATNPLYKIFTDDERYENSVKELERAWVENTFKYVLSKKDVNWFMGNSNFVEFKFIMKGLPLSVNSELRKKYGKKFESLLLSSVKALVKDVTSLNGFRPVIDFLIKWRDIEQDLKITTNSPLSIVRWEESSPSPEAIKVILGANYKVSGKESIYGGIPIEFNFSSNVLLSKRPFNWADLFKSLVDEKYHNELRFEYDLVSREVEKVFIGENAYKSMSPKIRSVIDIFKIGNNPIINVFNPEENLEYRKAIKKLVDGINKSTILNTFTFSVSAEFIEEPLIKEVEDSIADIDYNTLLRELTSYDDWNRYCIETVFSSTQKTNNIIDILKNNSSATTLDVAKYKLAKACVKSVVDKVRQSDTIFSSLLSHNKLIILKGLLAILFKNVWDDNSEIEDALWNAINTQKNIYDMITGENFFEISDSDAIEQLKIFILKKHPEFIEENVELIGSLLGIAMKEGIDIPDFQIDISDKFKFELVVKNMFNYGSFLVLDFDIDLVVKGLKIFKKVTEKYMKEIIVNFNKNSMLSLEDQLLFVTLVCGLAGDKKLEDSFIAYCEENKKKVKSHRALEFILAERSRYTSLISQKNKQFLRRMYDLLGERKDLKSFTPAYLQTLSKEDLRKDLESGEFVRRVSPIIDNRVVDSFIDALKEVEDSPDLFAKVVNILENGYDERYIHEDMKSRSREKIISIFESIVKDDKKSAQEVFSNLPVEIKDRIVSRYFSEIFFKIVRDKLMNDNNPIKPMVELSDERIETILKYNSIRIPSRDNIVKSSFDIDKIKQIATELANSIESVHAEQSGEKGYTRTEYLERKSVEYDRFNRYKHGSISVKFLDEFDVNIPKQIKGQEEFKKSHPNTEEIYPAFHGTGSIAASMILRYGFSVINSKDSSVTGRMLGDGIYFSTVIDKVAQYINDGGYSRDIGSKGYIFQMKALLGDKDVDYKAAGLGNDNIISPEWCVFSPNEQLKIEKAFLVEIISREEMDELKIKYGVKEESAIMEIKTFKEFLHEAVTEGFTNATTYIFMTGFIPINEDKCIDFEELISSGLLPYNVRIEPSGLGPMVIIDHNGPKSETFYVDNTTEFMQQKEELLKFLKLAFNYVPETEIETNISSENISNI